MKWGRVTLNTTYILTSNGVFLSVDKGYDAIENVNDLNSDMPIIMFNSSKTLGKFTSVQTGKDAINEILNRRNT